jgi:hypothetical protein
MKTCIRCMKSKNIEDFFNDKYTSDGKCPSCKECVYLRRKKPKPKLFRSATHKQCPNCNKVKPNEDFYKDSAKYAVNGRYSLCIICKNQATMKWREENKEYYNKSMRDYRAAQDPNDRRDIDLKSWFGLPYGWYKETLEKQGNTCAICKKPNRSSKRCLAVDHIPGTSKAREILCYKCNRDMHVVDNPEHLDKLLEYKRKHE